MSRRRAAEKRTILPDHKFKDIILAKFMNRIMLDGKKSNLEETDIARRNTITTLLSDWGLLSLEKKEVLECAPLRTIKIISFKEKHNWELCPKYNIGRK